MQTANEVPKKKVTPLEQARADLDQRQAEEIRARESLASLVADRAAKAADYAADMTDFAREAVRKLDTRIADARVTLEAFTTRSAAATRASADAERAAMVAEYEAAKKRANVQAATDVEVLELVAFIVETDRAIHEKLEAARGRLREQRGAAIEAARLASDLGIGASHPELHLDDVRVVCAVAVAQARHAEERTHSTSEHFFEAIPDPFVWVNGARTSHPNATPDQHEFAVRALAKKAG